MEEWQSSSLSMLMQPNTDAEERNQNSKKKNANNISSHIRYIKSDREFNKGKLRNRRTIVRQNYCEY